MKKLILGLSLLLAQAAFAATGGGGLSATYIRLSPTTMPTICRQGDLRTDSSSSLNICDNANTWNAFGSVGGGGTGLSSATAHGVLLGEGTSAFGFTSAGASGSILQGAGGSTDPSFTSTPTLGIAGTTLGSLALSGNSSGTVTVKPQAAAGTYNFNLPITAGTSGQPMLSAGGGSSPMTYGTLGAAFGGTGIDLSGSTGAVSVSGGTVSAGTLSVANGGSGLVTRTTHSIQVGAGSSNLTQLAVGSTGTLLTGVSSSDPAFSATPVLGASGTTGTLGFSGTSSGVVTVQPQSAAGTYNFNLPTTAGGSGTVLTSQGGGSTAMTWSSVLSNPMTTLGDIMYENASPAATALAGNITTTKKFLTQTGTGSISAVPAWGILAVADLPTFTTALFVAPTFSYVTASSHSGGFSANSSGTYTVPTSPRSPVWIEVFMVGGGGGGEGSGTLAGGNSPATAGGNGGNTTLGSSVLTAAGGTGGTYQGTSGPGGAPTVNTFTDLGSFSGSAGTGGGSTVASSQGFGGAGGSSAYGGAGGGGGPGGAGSAGATNSGGGGGGAGAPALGFSGAGGGGGAYVHAANTSPSATYSYAVGAVGSAGAAATSGNTGGAGGTGSILIKEYYQ